MREELIVSGRSNPLIDPHLEIWEWQIPAYLFLGGLAAGILFFAGLFYLRGREDKYPTAVRVAPVFVPVLLAIGLLFLFLDLKHKFYFWRLYTSFSIESPTSWGAWTLLLVMPLSVIWAALYIESVFPKWDWKYTWAKDAIKFLSGYKREMAWGMVVLAIILGIYTGILLSAFNARPLWNTSILGPLFLTSGLSTGAAFIVLLSKNKTERHAMGMIDLMLISIEVALIIHMFMGFKASTRVQIEAADMFLGGQFTATFWVFVFSLGLIVPAFLEFMETKGKRIPFYIAPSLVIFGGILFRFIMVHAGQLSRWLY